MSEPINKEWMSEKERGDRSFYGSRVVANIGETTIGDVAIEMEDTEEKNIREVGIGMGNFVNSFLDCMKELWVMAVWDWSLISLMFLNQT
ncbi:hypothetical protein IFM89_035354 [Coptis chinensis]|uniref:Uncharacterized protein n=1 Tax=Coptis chinensis TaxID=261450 RepID=A0A835H2A7_9MAGN|nr:hypothetical protein IFM89_035354 [Coptis chinensis]